MSWDERLKALEDRYYFIEGQINLLFGFIFSGPEGRSNLAAFCETILEDKSKNERVRLAAQVFLNALASETQHGLRQSQPQPSADKCSPSPDQTVPPSHDSVPNVLLFPKWPDQKPKDDDE
jgi:hypothetical protein